jgi:hypothetical protein
VGIGAGTVSEIVKAYRQRNPDFDHLRELVVAIKKEGANTEEYAYVIRIRRMLKDYDLTKSRSNHS